MSSLETILKSYPGSQTFQFGDSEALCSQLLSLVRSGRKVATCGALRDYESGSEPMPEVGRIDIALNWDGTPALAIETIAVEQTRFCDVEEVFALAEGENETLEGWRIGHEEFFKRNGGFQPEMMLVCERFRMVEDFGIHRTLEENAKTKSERS